MEDTKHITQREWEDYVCSRDEHTKLCAMLIQDMTEELWVKYREVRHTIDVIEEAYWDSIDSLHQRYDDSLNKDY
jgi:hypothetical protein